MIDSNYEEYNILWFINDHIADDGILIWRRQKGKKANFFFLLSHCTEAGTIKDKTQQQESHQRINKYIISMVICGNIITSLFSILFLQFYDIKHQCTQWLFWVLQNDMFCICVTLTLSVLCITLDNDELWYMSFKSIKTNWLGTCIMLQKSFQDKLNKL